MNFRHALPVLLLSLFPATQGLPLGTAASKALLVGVTTGPGEDQTSEVVTVDPRDGKVERIGRLVLAGGHRPVQAQDLAWSADGKQLIVTELEFSVQNEAKTWIDWVDPASLKVLRSSEPSPGVLDSLCWDGQQHLLATYGVSRPQTLLVLDAATGARTEIGTLDKRLWVRSLVWRATGSELWALHTRTPELDYDALVKFAPKDGAVLQIVKLEMAELATALVLDARGEFIVTGDKGGVFSVDPATGKCVRAKLESEFRITGLVLGR